MWARIHSLGPAQTHGLAKAMELENFLLTAHRAHDQSRVRQYRGIATSSFKRVECAMALSTSALTCVRSVAAFLPSGIVILQSRVRFIKIKVIQYRDRSVVDIMCKTIEDHGSPTKAPSTARPNTDTTLKYSNTMKTHFNYYT
jgi:hypothetical protein